MLCGLENHCCVYTYCNDSSPETKASLHFVKSKEQHPNCQHSTLHFKQYKDIDIPCFFPYHLFLPLSLLYFLSCVSQFLDLYIPCHCSQPYFNMSSILSSPVSSAVAPDTINSHVKTCHEEQKNLHFFAPEYGGRNEQNYPL